jgi:hypothetical protein
MSDAGVSGGKGSSPTMIDRDVQESESENESEEETPAYTTPRSAKDKSTAQSIKLPTAPAQDDEGSATIPSQLSEDTGTYTSPIPLATSRPVKIAGSTGLTGWGTQPIPPSSSRESSAPPLAQGMFTNINSTWTPPTNDTKDTPPPQGKFSSSRGPSASPRRRSFLVPPRNHYESGNELPLLSGRPPLGEYPSPYVQPFSHDSDSDSESDVSPRSPPKRAGGALPAGFSASPLATPRGPSASSRTNPVRTQADDFDDYDGEPLPAPTNRQTSREAPPAYVLPAGGNGNAFPPDKRTDRKDPAVIRDEDEDSSIETPPDQKKTLEALQDAIARLNKRLDDAFQQVEDWSRKTDDYVSKAHQDIRDWGRRTDEYLSRSRDDFWERRHDMRPTSSSYYMPSPMFAVGASVLATTGLVAAGIALPFIAPFALVAAPFVGLACLAAAFWPRREKVVTQQVPPQYSAPQMPPQPSQQMPSNSVPPQQQRPAPSATQSKPQTPPSSLSSDSSTDSSTDSSYFSDDKRKRSK